MHGLHFRQGSSAPSDVWGNHCVSCIGCTAIALQLFPFTLFPSVPGNFLVGLAFGLVLLIVVCFIGRAHL